MRLMACRMPLMPVAVPACQSLPHRSTKTCVSAIAPPLCSEPPPSYPQWPVHYLVGVYARAAGTRALAG